MAPSNAQIFESLRASILLSLVDSRHSIDDSFGALTEDTIRQHFDSALRQIQGYLHRPSSEQLNRFVSHWSAMLMGLGLSHSSVLRAVVTLGDLVVQTTKNTLPPSKETNLFIRAVVRMNFDATREIVRGFNQELVTQEGLSARP